MPQISSNKTPQLISSNQRSVVVEVSRFLKELSQHLDDEICNALLEENNELAERLNLHFTKAKRLANELQTTGHTANNLQS